MDDRSQTGVRFSRKILSTKQSKLQWSLSDDEDDRRKAQNILNFNELEEDILEIETIGA